MGVQNTSTAGKPNPTMNKEATKVLHTQGEWKVEDGNIVKCNEAVICTARRINVSDEEANANARLIASAPAMLQTLQEILETYQNKEQNGGGLTIHEKIIVGNIIKAIEKATK